MALSTLNTLFKVRYTNKFTPGRTWLQEIYYNDKEAFNRISILEALGYLVEIEWRNNSNRTGHRVTSDAVDNPQ
jgi:hypothetical protein